MYPFFVSKVKNVTAEHMVVPKSAQEMFAHVKIRFNAIVAYLLIRIYSIS